MGFQTRVGLTRDGIQTLDVSSRVHSPEYRAMLALLRAAREECGYSQDHVARLLGKPQSYVSKVERGERRIDPPELAWFAYVYKKRADYFLQATTENITRAMERELERLQASLKT